MFDVRERTRVSARVLELAAADPRVASAAIVGSLALGGGDEWSDVDLTFGLADGVPVAGVLDDFSRVLADEFDAVQLLDLHAGGTTYRVFLLADWLQVDLSFTPSPRIPKGAPQFRLVFGSYEPSESEPPSADDLFGWAVLYARHARVCIDRGNLWQAEHCVSAVRERALILACLRLGLPTAFGRGYDALPDEAHDALRGALVSSLERGELERALGVAVAGLLRESPAAGELATRVEAQLRAL